MYHSECQRKIDGSIKFSQSKRSWLTHPRDDSLREVRPLGTFPECAEHLLLTSTATTLPCAPAMVASGSVKKPIAAPIL